MLRLLPLEANGQLFVSNVEAIIDQVTNEVAIDRANKITRL